jgi:hypothetical protein
VALIDDQIAALEAAIAAGVLKVRTRSGEDEQEVQYASFSDMMARLNWLKRKKAQEAGTDMRVTVGTFDRGRDGARCPDDWDRA